MNRHANPANHHVASMTGGELVAVLAASNIDKSRQTADYLGMFVDGGYCIDAPGNVPSGASAAGQFYLTVDSEYVKRDWL